MAGRHNRNYRGSMARVPEELRGKIVQHADKHKYAYPLDPALRAVLAGMRQPHPRSDGSIDSDAPRAQRGEGGANPTPSLQS